MKVLITGGAGFIGIRLARRLLGDGHQVTVLDNFAGQVHGKDTDLPPDLRACCSLFRGNITDRGLVDRALQSVDAVVHLAAETGPAQSMYDIYRYYDHNVQGTAVLLEAMRAQTSAIYRFVVASSRAIYGEGKYHCDRCAGPVYPAPRSDERLSEGKWEPTCPQCGRDVTPLPTDEEAPPRPTSQYAVTKWTQEQMALVWGRAFGVPTIALRYQNVYGAGQSLTNPYIGVLAIFAARIKEGHPIRVYEDGAESRDFVHVDDVIEATYRALVQNQVHDCMALNVGSGQRTSLRTVAETLRDIMKGSVPIEVTGQYRVGDIRHCYADLSAIARALGFEPKVSLEAGLRELVAWSWKTESSSELDRATEELARAGLFRGGRGATDA